MRVSCCCIESVILFNAILSNIFFKRSPKNGVNFLAQWADKQTKRSSLFAGGGGGGGGGHTTVFNAYKQYINKSKYPFARGEGPVPFAPPPPPLPGSTNTLLKSNVTRRDHVVRCRGSQECWFTLCQFCCQFHLRRHSLCITLKSTTLVCMRSSNVWTTKPWQRS